LDRLCIDSPSVAHVGYDISPLKRVKFKIFTTSVKENLFLPLFNTNFISKLEINAFEINAGKGTRHFNPLEDYRYFHHWFSGVKTP